MSRITPDELNTLKNNEVYVFPSNLAGKNISEIAKNAELRFGARYGKFFGQCGRSYAIPIIDKDMLIKLPLIKIKRYVEMFCEEAKTKSWNTYYLVGFGKSGIGFWPIEDIAPIFAECAKLENVYLPREIVEYLSKQSKA